MFKKLLEQGEAGDTWVVMLRGRERDACWRGGDGDWRSPRASSRGRIRGGSLVLSNGRGREATPVLQRVRPPPRSFTSDDDVTWGRGSCPKWCFSDGDAR